MCGLVGFIPNKKKPINTLRFKSLMIYNEDRGKLSTGIYNIEGIRKDTVKASTFLKDQKWNTLTKNSIYLGHTRQPSVGYSVSMEGAQPIEMDNIVLVHNGSIYNKEKLAEKYKVETEKTDTDSVVMARILDTKQFEVLNYYNGAAALIWIYKDDPNTLYFYKGASKKNSHYKVESEERPLYKMNTNEGVYFSSLEDSLQNIALHEHEIESIVDIEPNIVYSVNTEDLTNIVEVCKVTRIGEIEEEKSTKNKNNRSNVRTWPQNDWDDYDNGSCGYVPKSKKKKIDSFENAVKELCTEEYFIGYNKALSTNDVRITDEKVCIGSLPKDVIYFNRGRYWFNGTICKGCYSIKQEDKSELFYTFLNGILLDEESEIKYPRLLDIIKTRHLRFGTYSFADFMTAYSDQPIPYYDYTQQVILHAKKNEIEFDGRYKPKFFNRGTYLYIEGYFMNASKFFNVDNILKDDVVELEDGQHAIVASTSYTGFWALTPGSATQLWCTYSEIKSIVEDTEEIVSIKDEEIQYVDEDDVDESLEIDKKSKDKEDDEFADFIDIISELDDNISDAIEKLTEYSPKGVSIEVDTLVEALDLFRTNNIVI